MAERHQKTIRRVSPGALRLLIDHSWPGNVRELKTEVERAVLRCADDGMLKVEHFASIESSWRFSEPEAFRLRPFRPLADQLEEVERRAIPSYHSLMTSSIPTPDTAPTLAEIRAARETLGDRVRRTPVWEWTGREIRDVVEPGTRVFLKLELFQHAGTFKPRGALLNMLELSPEQLERGVTAVSAGNHALAVAWAAKELGTTAKVVMPKSANPARVEGCRADGAEVVLVAGVHEAFAEVERIQEEEGRSFVHPFEGKTTTLGTATVGLELCEQAADLDVVIVPIGGGGLIAGIACAVKRIRPICEIFGVEPEGADTMHRSFEAGEPRSIDQVDTIADSLGAPHAAPYSFSLARRFVDELVKVSDDELRDAMRLMLRGAKLAVEPAGAAAIAALVGPLRQRLAGRRVGIVVCGSNIDPGTYGRLIA